MNRLLRPMPFFFQLPKKQLVALLVSKLALIAFLRLIYIVAAILFAWKYGTALEPEAKMYRLAADILNDSAIILDCLSPAFPSNMRVAVLCLSGTFRALCGVTAGGAKAALSLHFSKGSNVGELNAKDSSQETVIGLIGMLVRWVLNT